MNDHFFFKAFCIVSTIAAFSNSNHAAFQRQQIINMLEEIKRTTRKDPY
jgi:hypothetical protein